MVGLPGSGKSTVGRQLARRLQLPFFDSDLVIERQLGCSIREYFEREGEARFREVEESVLDDLSQSEQGVLSTGGGAVLRPANRRHLRARCQVVYLNSSPDELFRRLRHDVNRPLLQVADPLGRLRDLYAPLPGNSAFHHGDWSTICCFVSKYDFGAIEKGGRHIASEVTK